MAIHTVHLIIAVLLINFTFTLAISAGNAYSSTTNMIEHETINMSENLASKETLVEKTMLETNEDGTINLTGMQRQTGGDLPNYAEAGINLGSNFSLINGLAIGTIMPINALDTMIRGALNERTYLIAILYMLLSMILVGVNIAMYKRGLDIIWAKLPN